MGALGYSSASIDVGSLRSIVLVVNDSADCNISVSGSGRRKHDCSTYNWNDFLAPHLKKIMSIKKYYWPPLHQGVSFSRSTLTQLELR